MKISIVLVTALSLAAFGCKKKGADCDKAVANMMEVEKADMSKMGMDDKTIDKMKGVAISRCKADNWPADTVKCMADAKTMGDAESCRTKLPKDMTDKLKADMMSASGMNAGGTAGSAPPPPAGSDMGSAPPPTGGSAAPGSDTGSAAAPAGGSAAPAGSAAK